MMLRKETPKGAAREMFTAHWAQVGGGKFPQGKKVQGRQPGTDRILRRRGQNGELEGTEKMALNERTREEKGVPRHVDTSVTLLWG